MFRLTSLWNDQQFHKKFHQRMTRDIFLWKKEKGEWEENATRNTFIEIGKNKGKKKNGGNMIRQRFDKLNIIIKVSLLHSLLIAKRGGCGLIELAQCLRRGVAEQDMPFVCTASAVWRILYERWNFVFSRTWRDGLRVVPSTTKGEPRVTLCGIRGKDDFFLIKVSN